MLKLKKYAPNQWRILREKGYRLKANVVRINPAEDAPAYLKRCANAFYAATEHECDEGTRCVFATLVHPDKAETRLVIDRDGSEFQYRTGDSAWVTLAHWQGCSPFEGHSIESLLANMAYISQVRQKRI